MQHRRQADDKKVERTKDFGIHRVAVHLVPESALIGGILGTDDGKVAERHTRSLFRQSSRKSNAVVPVGNLADAPREWQPAQSHQILWELLYK